MRQHLDLTVGNEQETEQLGMEMGRCLHAGAVVGIDGPLGAGKTRLIRGIALGLDIPDPSLVTSPTFVLQQDYEARLPIHHFDVFRFTTPEELRDLGALELFEEQGVCLIEWASKVQSLLPETALSLRLEITGETTRSVHVDGEETTWLKMFTRLTEGRAPTG